MADLFQSTNPAASGPAADPGRTLRVAVPVPVHQLFDYAIPDDLQIPVIGARVAVPFGGRRLVGIVMAHNPADAHDRLRPIAAVLDDASVFGAELFRLASWMASYYQHPIGEVLATVLPAAARKPVRLTIKRPECWEISCAEPNLQRSPRQRALYETIAAAGGTDLSLIHI